MNTRSMPSLPGFVLVHDCDAPPRWPLTLAEAHRCAQLHNGDKGGAQRCQVRRAGVERLRDAGQICPDSAAASADGDLWPLALLALAVVVAMAAVPVLIACVT